MSKKPQEEYDVRENLITAISNKIGEELNQVFIEGLRRKGFIFERRKDIEKFAVECCTAVDYSQQKIKVFYANDTPFLLHDYSLKMIESTSKEYTIKIDAVIGVFYYL